MKFTKRILTIGLTMGLFGFFKKSPEKLSPASPDNPYKDSVTNLIYNLLFCDDLDLYKANTHPPYTYPFDILFSEASKIADLQKVVDKPRLPHPTKGNTRITFLVSDGLYFGEGPTEVLFSDPLASPALTTATQLMQYLTTTQNPTE